MNNEPVAWYKKNSNDYLIENIGQPSFQIEEFIDAGYIPLYTQDQLEEARKLGMQQERALWELAASTQEIMDTHPAKEHFEDEPQAEELHEILQSNTELTDEEILDFINAFCLDMGDYWELTERNAIPMIRAILRKAQEIG